MKNKKNVTYELKESLKGKVTLVTGATDGIGKVICKRFAELGSFVYIYDIKGTKELTSYINEQYEAPRSMLVPCDI